MAKPRRNERSNAPPPSSTGREWTDSTQRLAVHGSPNRLPPPPPPPRAPPPPGREWTDSTQRLAVHGSPNRLASTPRRSGRRLLRFSPRRSLRPRLLRPSPSSSSISYAVFCLKKKHVQRRTAS